MKKQILLVAVLQFFLVLNGCGSDPENDPASIPKTGKATSASKKLSERDSLAIEISALLHEIAEGKSQGSDDVVGTKVGEAVLAKRQVTDSIYAEHIIKIIENISFESGNFDPDNLKGLEILQDADRLDGKGSIRIPDLSDILSKR